MIKILKLICKLLGHDIWVIGTIGVGEREFCRRCKDITV